MSDSHVDYLRELVEKEHEAAVDLAALDGLLGETARVRERAARIRRTLDAEPIERARHGEAVTAARRDLEARVAALAVAEREVASAEAAGEDADLASARRQLMRAQDAVITARQHLERTIAASDAFEEQVAVARRELPLVEEEAASLAAALAGRARGAGAAGDLPSRDLAGIDEWAVAARAALTVARASAATERDAIMRQADEVGSAVLGEAHIPSGPRAVLTRLEAREQSS
ncbi:MAG: hypothetical protein ACE5EV_06065 [Gaiellales bacterium]